MRLRRRSTGLVVLAELVVCGGLAMASASPGHAASDSTEIPVSPTSEESTPVESTESSSTATTSTESSTPSTEPAGTLAPPDSTEPTETTESVETTEATQPTDVTEPITTDVATTEPTDSTAPETTEEPGFGIAAVGEYCNTAPITTQPFSVASPYPSTITVSSSGTTITQVTVQLAGITHDVPSALDVLLVGPSGENVILMSDAGGGEDLDNVTLTFVDGAPGLSIFGPLTSGTYRPTNHVGADEWPPPAPPSSGTTLLQTFNGTDPNGTWSLYVVSDGIVGGSIGGGWCLTIGTIDDGAAATETVLASSPNPSVAPEEVLLTATVTTDGEPVTEGTVTFREGSTILHPAVAVDDQGQATFSIATLAVGEHTITADYNGASALLTSSGELVQVVRAAPTSSPAQGMWCNTESITSTGAQSVGFPARPYPSVITVTDAPTAITGMTVQLGGISTVFPRHLSVLLVGPRGENVILMRRSGGEATEDVTLTFVDGAAALPPSAAGSLLVTGTYRPTDNGTPGSWPAPAPPPSGATALATFDGTDPNGTWALYVFAGGQTAIAGGWCLSIDGESPPAVETTTVVTSSANPATFGQEVTFAAAVTSDGGGPVADGTVTFREGGSTLGIVDVDDQGVAVLPISTLAVGTHAISATYNGTPGLYPSTGQVSQVVVSVAGTGSCANNPISTFRGASPAAPYPSVIEVDSAGSVVTDVVVQLTGVLADTTSTFGEDLDVLLVGPGGENLVLMSDAGFGGTPGSTFTFADGAAELGTSRTGIFRPTNFTTGNEAPDDWPAPAPDPSSATELAVFDGTDPNGIWSLYVVTDSSVSNGTIAGWCLAISALGTSSTALVSAPNPSVVGDPVTITATVTSGGEPVGDGDVTFTDTSTMPATVLAADVPVDAEGRATATVDTLAVGAHDITASFDGSVDYVPSEGTLTHVVVARTSTELTSAPNPSDFGAAVTFTAAVTSGGAPVVEGDVTFVDQTTATTLGSGVVLDAQGRATIEIDDLAVGSHLVVASYGGASLLAPSSSDQIVHRVRGIADAGGPYVIGEGDGLVLDASGSQVGDTASYGWDLDGDGSFDDAAGVNPTVAWAELVALGIDDGDGSVHPVSLEVTDGGESFTAVTSLTVMNVAATVTFDGPTTATVGVPFTIKVGADDPSAVDMAGTFVYTVDWGDGTAPLTVSGPADPPVTHTYTAEGSYTLSATVTDPDGATSEPATLTITVSPAGATTMVAAPAAALPRTGGTTSTVVVAGFALFAAGALTLVASQVRTARPRRGHTGG